MIVIDELDTAVLELDGGQHLRWMNPAAEECLSLSRDRIVGRPLDSVPGVPERHSLMLMNGATGSWPYRLGGFRSLVHGKSH